MFKAHQEIEVDYLRRIISYDPKSGILTWRARTPCMFSDGAKSREWQCSAWNAKRAGSPALNCKNDSGYFRGNICGRQVRAHHVAWAIYYGEWPNDQIDHINGDRSDNRIDNLRIGSQSQNMANAARRSRKTRFRGIFPNGSGWSAKVCVNYKQIYGGTFSTEEEAARRYDDLARENFGEFAILNYPAQSDQRPEERRPFSGGK